MTEMQQAALLDLLQFLRESSYHFVTPTPATHARVLARPHLPGDFLQQAFGWNVPVPPDTFPPDKFLYWLQQGLLAETAEGIRSRVRVASLDELLFLHSTHPTQEQDAVFFGPDTYRFVRFLLSQQPFLHAQTGKTARLLDMGCGSGAGGIVLGRHFPDADITLCDINENALACARLNARHNGVAVHLHLGDLFAGVQGQFDLIIANPPYLNDSILRAYRHGGGTYGEALSLKIAEAASERLTPGGRLLLYTGSAISSGQDLLRQQLMRQVPEGMEFSCEEIDVDIFGEELEREEYRNVDRIAALGVVMRRP